MKIIEKPRKNLETEAIKIIEKITNETLQEKSQFIFAVAGGNSVIGIFEKLQSAKIDWQKIHLFLADERVVPNSDPDSNFKNLHDNLISKIEIPTENIHAFDDTISPAEALKKYQTEFTKLGGQIDLILLSVGEDGHIASLFPYHESVQSDEKTGADYILIENSPKPPKNRFSLSKNAIANSQNAILLFFGAGKYDAFQDFNNPLLSERECPAKIAEKIENSFILADVVK